MEHGSRSLSGLRRTTDFIVSPYLPDALGQMQPIIPSGCLQQADVQTCHLVCQMRRERKCGPGYALVVLYCRTHHCCFTLYPPGYYPYARLPLLNLKPDGALSSTDGLERDPFDGTRLELITPRLPALIGKADNELEASNKATRRQASRAQVKFAATLLGISVEEYTLREQVAVVLALLASALTAAVGAGLAR